MSTGVLDSFKSRPSQQTKKKKDSLKEDTGLLLFGFLMEKAFGFTCSGFWFLAFGLLAFGFLVWEAFGREKNC
jgi:hypothetical protein